MVFCAMLAARTVMRGASEGGEPFSRVDVEYTLVKSVLKRVAQTKWRTPVVPIER